MEWNLTGDRPIWLQLTEKIQLGIITGEYPAGERLASVRELAAEAAVNPNTMQKAFAELEGSGLVVTQSTSGRMVTEDSDLIRNTRKRMAIQRAEQFFSGMKELGFAKEEAMALLEERL